MHVKNVVICDLQQQYSRNLLQMLKKKKNSTFQLFLVHSVEEAKKLVQLRKIHILLIGSEFSEEQRKEIIAEATYVLVGNGQDVLLENEKAVYRYQKAKDIWETITQQSERSSGHSQLIGIYSPIHRIGKTCFAINMGKKLAQNVPVLYLNLEEYCYEGYFYEEESAGQEGNMSDLLYDFRQGKKNLAMHISMMTRQIGELEYIPPMPYVEDLQDISVDEWIKFLAYIAEQCIYEKIILDLGDGINGLFQILEQCDVIYTPYINEPCAKGKLNRYTENLRRSNRESILEKTIQKEMKRRKGDDEKKEKKREELIDEVFSMKQKGKEDKVAKRKKPDSCSMFYDGWKGE